MYVDIVPNRQSPPAILLRESVREGNKVVKRTLANLSNLSIEQAHGIRQILKGEQMVRAESHFDIVHSRAHGHVDAVLCTMRKLGLDKLLSTRRCKERSLVLAMVASRIVAPESKLSLTRSLHHTTLGDELSVLGADENDLYRAMDWLVDRQDKIETKLANRHLKEGSRILYDLSSSYFEGLSCPLAKRGYSRDQKKGKLQVNYGLLTDDRGCPVSISVYPGNTSDPTTLLPQVDRLQKDFNLKSVVIVGDRGMITEKQVTDLKGREGVDWITALKSGAIRKLMNAEVIQLDLFDQKNLFECSHPDLPGERLVACRNSSLATRRKLTRDALLEATSVALIKVQSMIAKGRIKSADKIGLRVGKVIGKYKMAKHFDIDIKEESLSFKMNQERVDSEAALDGIYVIRTSLADDVSPEDAVRHYKSLAKVERAFRSIKTMDIEVRPIRHYQEERVRAHIFLCMLAYYVKWHMMEAWRPLLFADDDISEKKNAEPVGSAKRSAKADKKASTKKLSDDSLAHSFQTLLANLATIVRNTCQKKGEESREKPAPTFTIDTQLDPKQKEAFLLIKGIKLPM